VGSDRRIDARTAAARPNFTIEFVQLLAHAMQALEFKFGRSARERVYGCDRMGVVGGKLRKDRAGTASIALAQAR